MKYVLVVFVLIDSLIFFSCSTNVSDSNTQTQESINPSNPLQANILQDKILQYKTVDSPEIPCLLKNPSYSIPITLVEIIPQDDEVLKSALIQSQVIWNTCQVCFKVKDRIQVVDATMQIEYSPYWHLLPDAINISMPDPPIPELVQALRKHFTNTLLMLFVKTNAEHTLGWSYAPFMVAYYTKEDPANHALTNTLFITKRAMEKDGYHTMAHELAHILFNQTDRRTGPRTHILYGTRTDTQPIIPTGLCQALFDNPYLPTDTKQQPE